MSYSWRIAEAILSELERNAGKLARCVLIGALFSNEESLLGREKPPMG